MKIFSCCLPPASTHSCLSSPAKKYLFVLGLVGMLATTLGILGLEGISVNAISYSDALATVIVGASLFVFSIFTYLFSQEKAPQHLHSTRKKFASIDKSTKPSSEPSSPPSVTPKPTSSSISGMHTSKRDSFEDEEEIPVELGDSSTASTGHALLEERRKTMKPAEFLEAVNAHLERSLLLGSPSGKEAFLAHGLSTCSSNPNDFNPNKHFVNESGHCVYGILSHPPSLANPEDTLCSEVSTHTANSMTHERSVVEAFKNFPGTGAIVYQRTSGWIVIATKSDFTALRIKNNSEADGPTKAKIAFEHPEHAWKISSFTFSAIASQKDYVLLGNWHLVLKEETVVQTISEMAKKNASPKDILTTLMSKIKITDYPPKKDLCFTLVQLPLSRE